MALGYLLRMRLQPSLWNPGRNLWPHINRGNPAKKKTANNQRTEFFPYELAKEKLPFSYHFLRPCLATQVKTGVDLGTIFVSFFRRGSQILYHLWLYESCRQISAGISLAKQVSRHCLAP